MTIGEAMARFYLAYLGVFTTVAVLFLSLGVLLGCWIGAAWQRRQRAGEQIDDSGWLNAWEPFEPGVARVADR